MVPTSHLQRCAGVVLMVVHIEITLGGRVGGATGMVQQAD